jgi:hypothetical protein
MKRWLVCSVYGVTKPEESSAPPSEGLASRAQRAVTEKREQLTGEKAGSSWR